MTTIYRAEQKDSTRCRAWAEVDGRRVRLPEYKPGHRGGYLRGDNGGPAYGYGGTGPHNLARSIIAHAAGSARINADDGRALVNAFCWDRLATHRDDEPLELTRAEVLEYIERWNAKQAAALEATGPAEAQQ